MCAPGADPQRRDWGSFLPDGCGVICVCAWAPTLNGATGLCVHRCGCSVCPPLPPGADPQRRDRGAVPRACTQVRADLPLPICVCKSAGGPPDVPRPGVSGRATCLPHPSLVPPALGPTVPAPVPRARAIRPDKSGWSARVQVSDPRPEPTPTPDPRAPNLRLSTEGPARVGANTLCVCVYVRPRPPHGPELCTNQWRTPPRTRGPPTLNGGAAPARGARCMRVVWACVYRKCTPSA